MTAQESLSAQTGTSPLWPADDPAAMNHITLLEGIINRLANNSASCKTWCITLVSALLGLTGATHLPGLVGIALIPVVMFGFLDTSYLAQERAYRALYKCMVNKIRARTYTLEDAFEADAPLDFAARTKAFFSWSVSPMYLSLYCSVRGSTVCWLDRPTRGQHYCNNAFIAPSEKGEPFHFSLDKPFMGSEAPLLCCGPRKPSNRQYRRCIAPTRYSLIRLTLRVLWRVRC
jgi:hypothetical protein